MCVWHAQICYGIIYRMGAKSLGEQMGVDENDAACYIESFKARYTGRHCLWAHSLSLAKQRCTVSVYSTCVLCSWLVMKSLCVCFSLSLYVCPSRDPVLPERHGEELCKKGLRSDTAGTQEIPAWDHKRQHLRQGTCMCLCVWGGVRPIWSVITHLISDVWL